MLEAKFQQSSFFKKIIDGLKDCVQLVNFNCSEKGIAAQAVDDSRVLLVSLAVTPDAFEEYRSDRAVTLGVDLNSLSKILRCSANEDSLTLVAEDSPDNMLVLFEDTKRERISEYSLKLMEIDADFLEVDQIDYDTTINMPSTEFAKIIRDLNQLSDSLNILVTKETIKFTSEGDFGSGSVIVKPRTDVERPEDSVRVELEKPVDLTFGSKYLLDIIKAASLSVSIVVKLSAETPALFHFNLDGAGHLQYFLAPKFNAEE